MSEYEFHKNGKARAARIPAALAAFGPQGAARILALLLLLPMLVFAAIPPPAGRIWTP